MKKKTASCNEFIEFNHYGSNDAVHKFHRKLVLEAETDSKSGHVKRMMNQVTLPDHVIKTTNTVIIPVKKIIMTFYAGFKLRGIKMPTDSYYEYNITTYNKNRDDLHPRVQLRFFPDKEMLHTQDYRDSLKEWNEDYRTNMKSFFLTEQPLSVQQTTIQQQPRL